MNSFNHYAYGAVGDWIYRVVAGIEIDPKAPGYRHILIQPQPGGGFTHVRASHSSPYGRVSSEWTLQNSLLTLEAEVPANTNATVRLPGATLANVSEGDKQLTVTNGITNVEQQTGAVIVQVGSGKYKFSYATSGLFKP